VRLLTRARSRRTDPELFAGLVTTCRYCGLLDESIAADAQVRRLDPATRTSVAYSYYLRGEFARTVETDSASMPFATSIAKVRLGDDEGARPLFEQLEHSHLEGVRLISATYHRAIEGDVEGLAPMMRRLTDSGFADPEGYFCLAAFVARAGALDTALDALERTVNGGYYCPSSLRHDPFWDAARSSERFAQLLARSEAGTASARAAFDRVQGASVLRWTS
jgi:eukaryotic-like serine/threonine-protein kinase